MTCGANHVCTAAKSQDDPSHHCTGICDATGTCKTKQGQACKATTECMSGTVCADGYCCNSACTGSCQACNITTSLGTCMTLAANTAPYTGHPACTGTDVCAGKCSGTSADCTYPTAACATASCSGNGYQGAGTCSAGTCSLPAIKTCINACVVASGGCTGECKPSDTGCSSGGVPQICDSNGVWQNQTACLTGFSCSTGSCTCASNKTNCTTACTDLQSDPDNCGSCGHNCLGGACLLGICQPVAITSNLASIPYLIGIDSEYVYYSQDSTTISFADDSYRVSKTASGASGSVVYTDSDGWIVYHGVIGTMLFFSQAGENPLWGHTIGSSVSTRSTLAATNMMPRWGSLMPTNYAIIDKDYSTTMTFNWYNLSNTLLANYSESTTAIAPLGGSLLFEYFAAGNNVYWVRNVRDSDSNAHANSGLFTASSSAPSVRTQLAGGTTVFNLIIIDVNAISLILLSPTITNSYFRVALPSGNGTNSPGMVPTGGVVTEYAVENSNGFYWADDSGNIKRCAQANCENTSVVLARGQGSFSGLYQDSTALYWSRSSPNQIMRLAK
jgi:hypothetical protein